MMAIGEQFKHRRTLPSQGTLGSTCGLGQGQARKALVPCLIGKCSQRGHRSLADMTASLVLGWNTL